MLLELASGLAPSLDLEAISLLYRSTKPLVLDDASPQLQKRAYKVRNQNLLAPLHVASVCAELYRHLRPMLETNKRPPAPHESTGPAGTLHAPGRLHVLPGKPPARPGALHFVPAHLSRLRQGDASAVPLPSGRFFHPR